MKLKRVDPTDVDLEQKGAWTEVFGLRYRVRRSTYLPFAKEIRRLGEISDENAETEDVSDGFAEAMGRHLITAWEGPEFEDGTTAECTPENVAELLKSNRDTYSELLNFANGLENYILENETATAKKSERRSSGNSRTVRKSRHSSSPDKVDGESRHSNANPSTTL